MPAHRRSFPDDNVRVEEEEEEKEEEEEENHSLSLLRPRKQSRFLQQPPNEQHTSRDPPSQQEEEEEEEKEEEGGGGQQPEEEEEEQAEGEEEEEEGARGGGGGGEEQEEEEEEEEDDDDDDDEEEEEGEEEQKDSDEEESSESDEKSEFVYVELPEIRKDVQCPICLGIIKKTRTVMECLHRFCRECIDKSMRLGNNECPACRTHCASRRSLRDDPNFDALIAVLFPDIDKYEEEELAFQEEERARNKQIQASIAQVMQRQSEALSKRRTLGKDVAGGLMRSQSIVHSRRKRNSRIADPQGSEDNENENNNNNVKDSSSADERITEVRPRKRRRRRPATRPSQPSSSADGGGIENDLEGSRERRGISPGLVWNPEMFAWGRGGTRSHTRYGSANGSSKSSRNNRLSKLVDHLQSLEETDEVNVHFALFSLDKKCIPDLDKPYFCSRLNLSVRHLCDYVARKLQLAPEKMEMCLVRGHNKFTTTLSNSVGGIDSLLMKTDSLNYDMRIVNGEETLAVIEANSAEEYLILGYREKKTEIS